MNFAVLWHETALRIALDGGDDADDADDDDDDDDERMCFNVA